MYPCQKIKLAYEHIGFLGLLFGIFEKLPNLKFSRYTFCRVVVGRMGEYSMVCRWQTKTVTCEFQVQNPFVGTKQVNLSKLVYFQLFELEFSGQTRCDFNSYAISFLGFHDIISAADLGIISTLIERE